MSTIDSERKKTRIVIAGGGFAGLSAARYFDKSLARRPDIEVLLISRENFSLFTPMLHEVAAGELSPSDIVTPVRRTLRHVKFVEADVCTIDENVRCVRCTLGPARRDIEFRFDYLLLTPGSETHFFDMEGVRDWAVTLKNLTDAALLRNRDGAILSGIESGPDTSCSRSPGQLSTSGIGRGTGLVCRT